MMGSVNTNRCGDVPRESAWRNWVCRYIARLPAELQEHEQTTLTPLGNRAFNGQIDYGELGNVHLCRMLGSPHAFHHGDTPFGAMRGRSWLLILQIQGVSIYEQADEERFVAPGQMHLLDGAEPFTVRSPKGCEQIIVVLPDGISPSAIERLTFFENSGRRPASMLYRTVHNAFDCHDQIDQISARHFSASILQLLSNMCREAMEVPEITNTRRKRLPLIATYLDEHLADEGVSPKTVSNALGCSVRTLHRMFRARSGLTFGAYLWQRRLERCVADLRDPRQSMRSITDIAHGWGFSSSAHFNRLFKASMGQSPGHYREGGQAGP